MRPVSLGVFGATGQVGGVMLRILEERGFPVATLRLFASERSAGSAVSVFGHDVVVEDIEVADFSGLEIALFACGAPASRRFAPLVAASGAVVIDNSAAWRMDPEVPLVVTEANARDLDNIPKGIVGNPNCTTMVAIPVLKPLHDLAGLRRVVVATYQAASGAGRAGTSALDEEAQKAASSAARLAFGGDAVSYPESDVFPGPLAFNVLPEAGSYVEDGSGETTEEQKYRNECRKILGLPELAVSCTCVRVPVFTGHSAALNLEFEKKVSVKEAADVLARAPGVELSQLPTPLAVAGRDVSLVGRIREDATVPDSRGLSLFVVGDNLRKGAALNAVQIAEILSSHM